MRLRDTQGWNFIMEVTKVNCDFCASPGSLEVAYFHDFVQIFIIFVQKLSEKRVFSSKVNLRIFRLYRPNGNESNFEQNQKGYPFDFCFRGSMKIDGFWQI